MAKIGCGEQVKDVFFLREADPTGVKSGGAAAGADGYKGQPYVERLLKEAAIQARFFGADRPVKQLHWGGGTPTFLPSDVMAHLMAGYGDLFNLQTDEDRADSVEIDPRGVNRDTPVLYTTLPLPRHPPVQSQLGARQ